MSYFSSKKIQHWIEYLSLRWIMLWIWLTPLPLTFRFAEVLGWFAFKALKIRRRVVMDNLTRAFPDKSENEKLEIGLRAYQNFAKFTMEYIRVPIEKTKDILAACEIEGLEHIDNALKKGKGVVVVGGHFSNFELMASMIPIMNYPTAFLVGRQHNGKVDDMINSNRALTGAEIIHMGVAVRGALKALRANKVLIFLSDQDARRDGVFVNFLGTPASTPQGAAAFVLKTGAGLIFGNDIRKFGGKHKIVYSPCPVEGIKGSTPENIQKVTQLYTSLLEDWIRKYPEQYFWMHRRWKTSPQ
ncbi:lysophospholipid acyltransferase family protein [bacterium]